MRKEIIGDCTLYLGDCMEVIPTLGRFDLCLTDPPYGIGADENPVRGSQKHEKKGWDRTRPGKEVFDAILNVSSDQIIWGGNYFTDYLRPSMKWLIWDKMARNFSLADCELAWTSQWKAARIMSYSRGAANQDGKEHPTQKPVALMSWCLTHVPQAKTIFAPFMGSGTTGVACAKAGLAFTGIEREPSYFDIACRRIEEAYKQADMFVAPPAPAKPANDNDLFGVAV